MAGKTIAYQDIHGASVPADVAVYQVFISSEGEVSVDMDYPIAQPTAAGAYAVVATIADKNYVWKNDKGDRSYTETALAWIVPATNSIYVGGPMADVQLTTGNSAYNWTLDTTYTEFDSSRPGQTKVRANASNLGRITIPVTVLPRSILSSEEIVRTAPMGTPFSNLNLPKTITVTVYGGSGNAQTVTGVPVTWSSAGYDPYALTQTVIGTLNLSGFPQLSDENVPAVTATVHLTYGTVEAPAISNYTKTYDGSAAPLPMPNLPGGIQSMTITGYDGVANPPTNVGSYAVNIDFAAADGFKLPAEIPTPKLNIIRPAGEAGTVRPVLLDEAVTYTGSPQRYHGADNIVGISSVALTYEGIDGTNYAASTIAPTNAGTYFVTAIFSPHANHLLADGNYTATLTMKKSAQDTPMAALESKTAHSLTISAVPGAEYSIDGGENWQDSPKFSGLQPDTMYTFSQRLKETENLYASTSRSVKGKTIADTGLNYKINYREETIHFDPEVIAVGEDYTFTDKLPTGSEVIPGSTIYVRLVDDGTGDPGPAIIDMLPDRPAAPDVKVRPFDLMNTTEDMEYSENGGKTWKPCENSQNVENRQGQTLLVRIAATDDSFCSDACIVQIPVRGDAPALEIDNAAEQMNSTVKMEYSDDGGETWSACTDGMSLSDRTGETLLVRYACDGRKPASNCAEITVPTRNSAPKVRIDAAAERLTAAGSHPEYWTKKGWVGLPADGLDVSKLCGQELSIRECYDKEHFASLPVTEEVLRRGEKPDLTVDREKQTINTTGDMEYSTDGGITWERCDPDMDVSDLTGQTILIRNPSTPDEFASEPAEIQIPNRAENPEVELDTVTETIDTTPEMDCSTDGGSTWNPCTEPLDVSDLTGQTILIREHGGEDSFPAQALKS